MATSDSAKSISRSLLSLNAQNFNDYELIIIDNASTDDTLNRINDSLIKPIKIISEPDAGVYDALNKGINLAEGDYIHFLHSDDSYAHNGVLESVRQIITSNYYPDLICSGISFLDTNGYRQRTWSLRKASFEINNSTFKYGWMPPHTGCFFKTSFFREVGYFDITFRISADYEWLLRSSFLHPRIVLEPTECIYMQMGGLSTTRKNLIDILREDMRALKVNNYPRATAFLKRLRKINQIRPIKLEKLVDE